MTFSNGAHTLSIDNGHLLQLTGNVTITGGSIAVNDYQIDISTNVLTLNGVQLTVGSIGYVDDTGGGGKVVTKGTTSISQGCYFNVPLEVNSGTTTASCASSVSFDKPITVLNGATLAIPSGQNLYVGEAFTVNSGGTVNGADTLSFDGSNKTLTNNGTISAPARITSTFGVTDLAGTGQWNSFTVAACSVEVYGTHSFTGAPNPITVSGTLTPKSGSTIIYNGSSAQTVTALPYENLEINNSAGAALSSAGSVAGVLTLKGGSFNIGSNLTLGNSASISRQIGSLSGTPTFGTQVSVTYTGTSAVTTGTEIPGGALTLQNLTISNSGGVILGSSATVNGTLSVTGGNLTTGANTVTLGNSGTITESGSYSVLGKLAATRTLSAGNDTFGGMGTEINAAGSPPGVTAVTRTTGTASTISSATAIKRYVDISPAVNSGLNATFVFHYNTGELNGTTESNLKLFKSTDGGSTWTNAGGTVNTSSHILTLTGVNSFSRWTAGEPLAGPTLSSISPSASDVDNTLNVRLVGTNFINGSSSVGFSGSGITVNSVTFGSSTQLTVSITISLTAPAGTRNVSVTTPGGTATLSNAFEVLPSNLPTVSGISPSSGKRGTTLNVVLTGSNYLNGEIIVAISGGGVTVNSVTVNSATQLTANITIAPSASATFRNVSVTNSYGTVTYSNGFQVVNPAPTVSSVAPATGLAGISLAVTVQGAGFIAGTTTVSFGAGITVSSVDVTSDHTLTAQLSISSGATPGARTVTVTNAAPGGGTATLAGAFSILPTPTLASVSPNSGTRGQALSVVLTGSNYVTGATTVDFGIGITVDSVTLVSSSQVRAHITISLAAAAGARDVSVSNSGSSGAVILSGGFTVTNPAPTITSIAPGTGGRGKLVDMTINGTGFIPGVTNALPVAGMTLMSATFVSPTQITGSFLIARDAALGPRDLTISNPSPGGGSATLPAAFVVQNPSPTVLSISPSTGLVGQSLSVVATGADFISGASSVDFGAGITVGSVTIDSAGTHLTAAITIASGATAGLRSVTVTNTAPGGGSSTLANVFTVANLAPTLTSLSTYAAGRGQTLNVTMTGTNFATGVTSASFGVGVTVNSVTVSSPTSAVANITVATSAVIGARSVSVTNAPPGGGTATLAFVLNVENPKPSLSAIAPASGARGQTLDVVLTGTGFVSGISALTLGPDITVNSFKVASFTQINANISIAFACVAKGCDVAVANDAPGGGSYCLTGGFTVTNPLPAIMSVSPSSANRGSIINITVTGSQFITGVTTLNFGVDIVVNSILVKSPTEILANVTLSTLAASGARTVTVTNASPGGGSANLPAGFTVGTGTATSVEGNMGMVPDEFALQEAYPNPFNPSTRIRYGVPEDSRVRIIIHNMLGNVVAELVNGERTKGTYELQWHADYLPSGVYLVRMVAESAESSKRYISSRKVVLVK
jgi:hypothetical protein